MESTYFFLFLLFLHALTAVCVIQSWFILTLSHIRRLNLGRNEDASGGGVKPCPSRVRVKGETSRKYKGSHLQDSPERLEVAALTLNDGTQDVPPDHLANRADSTRGKEPGEKVC